MKFECVIIKTKLLEKMGNQTGSNLAPELVCLRFFLKNHLSSRMHLGPRGK